MPENQEIETIEKEKNNSQIAAKNLTELRERMNNLSNPKKIFPLSQNKPIETSNISMKVDLSFIVLVCDDDKQYLRGCLSSIPAGAEIILITVLPHLIPENGLKNIEEQVYPNGTIMKTGTYFYYEPDKELKKWDYFSFAEIRNAAIKLCTRKFICSLDVDERICIEPDEIETLNAMPKDIGGIIVSINNFIYGKDNEKSKRESLPVLRIFVNDDKVYFIYRAHEQIAQNIINAGFKVIEWTPIIKHLGYLQAMRNEEMMINKFKRNYRLMILEMQNAESCWNPYLMERLCGTMNILKQYKVFEDKQAWL